MPPKTMNLPKTPPPLQTSPSGKLSDYSIFVNNTVTIEAPRQEVRHTEKEDGCTGCFKGLFKALRR